MESIENMTVASAPEPVNYDEFGDIQKCSVSGSSSCPMIRDALSQLTAEVRWARDKTKQDLTETEAECKRLADDYAAQNDDWSLKLQESQVKFSSSTGAMNSAQNLIKEKVVEANDLIEQLTNKQNECG